MISRTWSCTLPRDGVRDGVLVQKVLVQVRSVGLVRVGQVRRVGQLRRWVVSRVRVVSRVCVVSRVRVVSRVLVQVNSTVSDAGREYCDADLEGERKKAIWCDDDGDHDLERARTRPIGCVLAYDAGAAAATRGRAAEGPRWPAPSRAHVVGAAQGLPDAVF